jgi:hypothetical protein
VGSQVPGFLVPDPRSPAPGTKSPGREVILPKPMGPDGRRREGLSPLDSHVVKGGRGMRCSDERGVRDSGFGMSLVVDTLFGRIMGDCDGQWVCRMFRRVVRVAGMSGRMLVFFLVIVTDGIGGWYDSRDGESGSDG